jgi:PAS domain S-box-containing protein
MVAGLLSIGPLFRLIRDSERKVRRANRALRALSECNQAVIRAADEAEMLELVCRVVVEAAGYRLVWIGYAEKDGAKLVQPVAQHGFERGYLDTVTITWADDEHGRGPTGTAIRRGEPCVVRDILSDPDYEPWREEALKRGYQSSIALPLIIDGDLLGALNIYASEADAFDDEEVELLSEMTEDLSYGISAIRTRMAHEDSLRELQRLQVFHESVLENMIAGIVVQDAQLKLEYVNPAAAEMLGYGPEELVRQDWTVVVPEDQRSIVREADVRRARGEADQYELEVVRKDGERVPVLVSGRPRLEQGRLVGTVVVFTDLSELKQTERELAESQRALMTLMGNLPGMAYRCRNDRKWTMEFVSQGAVGLTGYEPSDLLLNRRVAYGDLIAPEDRERVWEVVQVAVEKKEPFQLIYRLKDAVGREKWAWEQGSGVYDQAGEVIALEGFITEITERIRAEEAAQRRYEELEAINAIITAASGARNLESLAQLALERTLGVLGLEMGGIWIGTTRAVSGLPSGFHESVRMALGESSLTLADSVAIEDWETYPEDRPHALLRPVMAEYGIRASLLVPVSLEGEVAGGLRLDASEPRRWQGHEIALSEAVAWQVGATAGKLRLVEQNRQQARQLQRVLDAVREGIVALDADRRVVLANEVGRGYLTTLGHAGEGSALEALGDRRMEEILTEEGGDLPHEIVVEGPDQHVFEVLANPSPRSKSERGWTLLIRDVTERRRVERRVELQERLAAVGQLAAGIAHDFNNIVGAIILYSEMLSRSERIVGKDRERVATIEQQAERATALVQQILDFSRRTVMKPHPVDLAGVLEDFRDLITRTIPENIDISVVHDKGEYVVSADPARLDQALMNLALNARDAMPEGGKLRFALGRLEVRPGERPPYRDMRPGDWIRLEVADSGQGIAPGDLPHVFEPFFSTKERSEGTGLGLAQVYGIIKQHGGYIEAQSELGVGTIFIMYLPALHLPALPRSKEDDAPLEQGRGERVLVVEDDPGVLEALEETLGNLNYELLTATDGRQALEVYREQGGRIDLVLSDLVMPGMGGKLLYESLREENPEIPFVLMTGYPLGSDTRQLFDREVVNWVQKPLDMHTLARIIREVLGGPAEGD